jgi:hypothetical protein
MHANQAWITLFRRVPANLHDGLTVGLRSGMEIAIQTILKLEPDFLILRGRLTGTQEGGKILLIPYAEMTVLSLARPLKDTEVEAIFGKGDPTELLDLPPVGADTPSAASAVQPAAKYATVNDPAVAVNPAKKPEQQSKSVLLAKLRERLKETPPTGK